ncbi:energy transducer TonB [Mariniflexile sp.]|uniref:energy transducer TonB n=1 Tax=Mariniflexile sp. TaxID=1979402 RepID=UPI004048333A
MGNPKKTHELIRQNDQIVKKSQKHDVNLRKNSTLYFQVGLIVCLLAAYGMLEMRFETTIPNYGCPTVESEKTFYVDIPIIRPKVAVLDELVKQKPNKPTDTYKEGPDTTPDIFEKPDKPTTQVAQPLDPRDFTLVEKPAHPENFPFEAIEHVPIYPGCENKKSNDEKRKCMSDKITKLVQKKFDTGLGSELGLSGKQVIRTQFKIDKTGHVTDIQVRGTHPDLEKEAERVINSIPEMTPGKQRDKNVGVIYNLPIVFQVE